MPVHSLTEDRNDTATAKRPGRPTAIFCDIDGCLYDWTKPLDLSVYAELRDLLAREAASLPFCLMTGRSAEFVKVLAALLGLDANPGRHLCELGALILTGVGPIVTLHPTVVAHGPERLRRERVRLMELLSGQLGATFEPSRDFTCNVVTVKGDVAATRCDEIRALVQAEYPAARVLDSGAVVDVALLPLSKADGVRFLASQPGGPDPASTLSIGDSENDLDVLSLTGYRAAPANAAAAVKAVVDYVSPLPGVAGVLDILRRFLLVGNAPDAARR